MHNLVNIWKLLGPGLLYAGAAVGVSHLVQSTKAGAFYGLLLIPVILVTNLIKFPFFEFGPRYAASTGKSLLSAYEQMGKWSVILFFSMSVLTMFTIQAAVTIVTASIASNLFGLGFSLIQWSIILLIICGSIITIGRYAVLDHLMKGIIILLTISTLIAVIFAFQHTHYFNYEPASFSFESHHIVFLIALIGWMPAPFDITIWHSLWTVEKLKGEGSENNLKKALLDFHIGYWGTALLAIGFVLLGAFSFYGTGNELSPKGTVFVSQLIEMYTNNIGEWSKPFIALAAFTTMFSTTLTCFDAFPRLLPPTTTILFPSLGNYSKRLKSIVSLIVVGCGALIILQFFISSMGTMIKVATILSFVTAPVLAYLNYRVINSDLLPDFAKVSPTLLRFSLFGLISLSLFSVWFILFQLGVV